MYGIRDYLAMVMDPVRTEAYRAALAATIRPGDVVLELGTGFGFFAVEACRLGAAHVHAIEPNDAIALGPAIAAANDCADRITFHQALSERVTVAHRADVLIEDLRGVSPLHRGRAAALADARARLLAPGARSVPRTDLLWCAPTEWPGNTRQPRTAPDRLHGIVIGPLSTAVASSLVRTSGGADALLAPGVPWATLALDRELPRSVEGVTRFVAVRDGTMAAIASWFSTELADGIGFDTAPGGPPTVYGHSLIPLAESLPLRRGETVTVRLRASFDGTDYVWDWEARAAGSAGTGQDGRTVRGSTLGADLLSPQRLARRAAGHRPARSGAIDLLMTLLAAVDGDATLEALARRVAAAHPARFADEQGALRWVSDRLAEIEDADAS